MPFGPWRSSWSIYDHVHDTERATVTLAGIAGKCHVLTTIFATLAAGTAPGAAYAGHVQVLFGATVKFMSVFAISTSAGSSAPPVALSGFELAAGNGESVTIEFTAAGIANIHQAVFAAGYTRAAQG